MFDNVILDSEPKPVPEGLVVINQEYVAKQPIHLKCVEGKGKRDAFTIADAATGHELFKLSSSAVSVHNDKKMEDAHGRPVFVMRSKLVSMRKSIRIYWPGSKDNLVFEARKKSSTKQKKLKIKTKVNGLNSKKEFPVVMMGNTTGTSAVVLLGEESTGHVIARVRTSPNATASLSGVKDYDIDVAAGVDTAMIAALAVIYNEYVDSTKDGGSSSSSSSDNEAKK